MLVTRSTCKMEQEFDVSVWDGDYHRTQVEGFASSSSDLDFDGVPDNIDNAPSIFNPDQSNIDGDGIGDVADACPSDPTNQCNQSGSAAVSIGVAGGVFETPNQSTEITVPANALPGDTSISITDIGTGFVLETDVGQSTAVFGVEIGPPGTTIQHAGQPGILLAGCHQRWHSGWHNPARSRPVREQG